MPKRYRDRNPVNANGHRRRQVRAQVLREETECWICGKPVDKTLKTPHPWSPEVDEIVPRAFGGSPIDRRNCRLAHRICNQRRGTGTRGKRRGAKVQSFVTSRRWGGAGTP